MAIAVKCVNDIVADLKDFLKDEGFEVFAYEKPIDKNGKYVTVGQIGFIADSYAGVGEGTINVVCHAKDSMDGAINDKLLKVSSMVFDRYYVHGGIEINGNYYESNTISSPALDNNSTHYSVVQLTCYYSTIKQ